MDITRREAIGMSMALALFAIETDAKGFAQAVTGAPKTGAVDVASYWSNFYDDALSTKATKTAAQPAPKRKTVYVHAADSLAPLIFADTIPTTALPKIQGDVLVKMAVSQYRPGKGDISTDVSHFRIDATQTFDYMNLVAPLSWATIASITPSNDISKLPTIDQLGFKAQANDTGDGMKQMTLPNGVGKFAVNVTRPANSTFTQIVQSVSVGVTSVLSMMTLPAISVPAVKVFTELFGKWQGHATVVMNGNLVPVIATSSVPANVPIPQQPMALLSGYYVMLPEEHVPELQSEFPNLAMLNGFLVTKDAAAAVSSAAGSQEQLTDMAKAAVPGVSYATLRLYVDKAPPSGCSLTPTTGTATATGV
jgi:hypothetical protein